MGADRPVVMGVLNVTPDSFSDGGRHLDPGAAAERAFRMVEEGADLVDVGGESTRPGAEPVPADEEWARIEPILERLEALPAPVSVDTTKWEVARRALDAGAAVLNDVSGLRSDPRLADLAASRGAGLVLMHMKGDPRTMQEDPTYADLPGTVADFLTRAAEEARRRGCAPDRIVLDPGIGFGKTAEGSLRLLRELPRFVALGYPVLVGPSRKSFIGHTLDLPVSERGEGTIAACVVALERGARLFRVHDVRATRRALDLAHAIRTAGAGAGSAGAGSRPGSDARRGTAGAKGRAGTAEVGAPPGRG